jgi:hypothetical protein
MNIPPTRPGRQASWGRIVGAGNAAFLRLPKLLDALEALPADRDVRLELDGLRHLDHACATALEGWVAGRVRTTVS